MILNRLLSLLPSSWVKYPDKHTLDSKFQTYILIISYLIPSLVVPLFVGIENVATPAWDGVI